MSKASEKEILDGVVIGFRNLVKDRYQFDKIVAKYDIPDSFDQERMNRYRDFFLEQMYPAPEDREVLNEAFKSLDNYLTHPDKLLRILFDSAAIVLRHGKSIPKLMGAGIKGFKSFRTATEFEEKLVRKAKSSGKLPPYSNDDINSFIKALRRTEIDGFIANVRDLLEILYDRALVSEIIKITQELIARMKKHRRRYSESEIAGLEVGMNMMIEGNKLFDELSADDQLKIFDIIIHIEVDVLEELFASGNE